MISFLRKTNKLNQMMMTHLEKFLVILDLKRRKKRKRLKSHSLSTSLKLRLQTMISPYLKLENKSKLLFQHKLIINKMTALVTLGTSMILKKINKRRQMTVSEILMSPKMSTMVSVIFLIAHRRCKILL